MWILISWLLMKSADLNLHCFQKKVRNFEEKMNFLFVSVHLEGTLIQEASQSETLTQRATSWRNKEMFVSIKNVSYPKLWIKDGHADEIIVLIA